MGLDSPRDGDLCLKPAEPRGFIFGCQRPYSVRSGFMWWSPRRPWAVVAGVARMMGRPFSRPRLRCCCPGCCICLRCRATFASSLRSGHDVVFSGRRVFPLRFCGPASRGLGRPAARYASSAAQPVTKPVLRTPACQEKGRPLSRGRPQSRWVLTQLAGRYGKSRRPCQTYELSGFRRSSWQTCATLPDRCSCCKHRRWPCFPRD